MGHSESIREAIWNQFGASIDMLENAMRMCPDEHWDTEIKFWYTAYHCIFWTDYYLTTEPGTFTPPDPFTFSEFNSQMPDRKYTKTELITYLEHCRQKAEQLISVLTSERLNERWVNEYKNYSLLEILLYNNRHIQYHAAQLNLLLRQMMNNAPAWVSQAKKISKG